MAQHQPCSANIASQTMQAAPTVRVGAASARAQPSGRFAVTHAGTYAAWPGAHVLVAISVNRRSSTVLQVSAIAAVVPDGRITVIVETTPLRVVLIQVNLAHLPRLHDKVGECKHVVSFIAQRPAVQLDRLGIIVANGNILIGFFTARSTVENIYDNDVPCSFRRRHVRWFWCIRRRGRMSRCWREYVSLGRRGCMSHCRRECVRCSWRERERRGWRG